MKSICCLTAATLVSVLMLAVPASADDGRFIVKFNPGRAAAARNAVQAAGGQVLRELGPQNALAALLPPQAVAALRANPTSSTSRTIRADIRWRRRHLGESRW